MVLYLSVVILPDMTTQFILQPIWVDVKYLLWCNFWCYLQMYNCLAQRKAPAKVIWKLGCWFANLHNSHGKRIVVILVLMGQCKIVHSGSKVHTPSNSRHSNQLLKTHVHTQQEFLEIYPHADVSIMVGILHVGLISFHVCLGQWVTYDIRTVYMVMLYCQHCWISYT